jgi:hypothetical protein
MRIEEITETKEVIVKKLYIANDGTVFNNEEECKKHEKTSELMSEYNKLVKGNISEFDLFFENGDVDYSYDIVEVKKENDIEIVNKVLNNIEKNEKQIKEPGMYLIGHDCDDNIYGYWTTLGEILNSIATAYNKTLIAGKEK